MREDERRGRRSGIIMSSAVRGVCNMLAVVMLGYAVFTGDAPVGLIALAVLIGNLHSYKDFLPFSMGGELAHALHMCSITMFIGAVLMVIFY